MTDDRRRYRLRQAMRAPSNRGTWARVALYLGLLIGIVVLQQSIGDRAAGCLAFFGQ